MNFFHKSIILSLKKFKMNFILKLKKYFIVLNKSKTISEKTVWICEKSINRCSNAMNSKNVKVKMWNLLFLYKSIVSSMSWNS